MKRTRGRPEQIRQGRCFACGCTDDFACDAGCEWTDALHTMCSECERRARAWLAWFKWSRATAGKSAKAERGIS